jgi:predicted ATP-grasp superfamily ATP-dependent carboligase
MRVLVTDAHSRAALGAIRSLGRAGHIVVACCREGTVKPPGASSRYSSEFHYYPDPRRQQNLFKEWIIDQASRRTVDAILPAAEASLVGVAAVRDCLPREVLALMPSDKALGYTLSKFQATKLALSVGVPCPETIFISDGSADEFKRLRFPIIIKTDNYFTPEGGYARGQHFPAYDVDQASKVLKHLATVPTRIIAQEFIMGSGAGAFLLRFRGETCLSFAHRRLHEVPFSGGASSFRESLCDEELVRFAEKLLDPLDYNGICMVEFKRDATKMRPYFLEINGRLWGSIALALHCGVDFPAALVDCHRFGFLPRHRRADYRSGVRCRNVYPGEVDHLRSVFRAAKKGSPQHETPPSKILAAFRFVALFFDPRIRHDFFWWSDPLPGIRQAWRMASWVKNKLVKKGLRRVKRYFPCSF